MAAETSSDQRVQRAAALSALALLALVTCLPATLSLGHRAVPVLLLGLLSALAWRRLGPGAVILVLSASLGALLLAGVLWQAAMPVALVVTAGAIRLGGAPGTIRPQRGTVPGLGTFGCAAVTPVALLLWVELSRRDFSDLFALVPEFPLPLLVAGAIGFAIVNALFEEWIWRSVFQTRLVALFGVGAGIALQAVSFGLAHAHGFPRGVSGIVLAGVWAVLLGLLRLRSRGLLAPLIAHFVADACIAAIVLVHAERAGALG